MTEAEVLKVIEKVVGRIGRDKEFGYFDKEDIKQEARIFCINAMPKYDGVRPLENFLHVVVRRLYINLRRDKFHRPGASEDHPKRRIMEPIGIDNAEEYIPDNNNIDILSDIAKKEMFDLIEKNLDISMLSDFLRLRSGDEVPQNRKYVVLQSIREILEEFRYVYR